MAPTNALTAAAVLAIATAPARAASFPEKPIRILTPFSAGSVTDLPVVNELFAELVRILGEQDVKTLYANAGLEATVSASPAEFAAYIRSEREKWAKVVKAANIRIE